MLAACCRPDTLEDAWPGWRAVDRARCIFSSLGIQTGFEMQLLQTPGQISILLLASPHQQFPLSVSEARVAMEIECQGNRTSCRESVVQVELWANGNAGAPGMATALCPEGRGWQKSLAPSERVIWVTENAVSGTLFREGLNLCHPHIGHRTGLVLSLFLCPRILAIQEAGWKLFGGEGGGAIL